MTRSKRRFLFRFLFLGSLGYAKSCAKNCIKVAIGRKKYFTFNDVFFRLYILQLLGIRPLRKITCIGFTGEGAGSQALMMMSAIAFARLRGMTYVHSPFFEIAHADRPMSEWVDAWETQFNLGLDEVRADAADRGVVNYAYNFSEMLPLFGVKNEDLTRSITDLIPEFRRKYYSNKEPRANKVLRICVHVRRGDVTPDHPGMWTDISVTAQTLAGVRDILNTHNINHQICIYSQGDKGALVQLDGPNTQFLLDVDPVSSMQDFIEGDILILANSSFSYVAGLISDGIKLAPDLYPPLSDWVMVDSSGEFDHSIFEQQILNQPAFSSAMRKRLSA